LGLDDSRGTLGRDEAARRRASEKSEGESQEAQPMKGRAARSGRLLQYQKETTTIIPVPARRVVRKPDGSFDLTAEVIGAGYKSRVQTITTSRSNARRRFLEAVDSIEPKVRESLRDLQPLLGEVKKWARRWNLSAPWILDVAIASLILWKNQDLSPDREWAFPFHVDRSFESEEFRVRGFNPARETQKEYQEEVAYCLRRYLARMDAEVRDRGLEPVPDRRQREGDHFDWLVRYQISGWSFYRIANARKIDQRAVSRAIKSLAADLPIRLKRATIKSRTCKPPLKS
jgi:hypothetical protein